MVAQRFGCNLVKWRDRRRLGWFLVCLWLESRPATTLILGWNTKSGVSTLEFLLWTMSWYTGPSTMLKSTGIAASRRDPCHHLDVVILERCTTLAAIMMIREAKVPIASRDEPEKVLRPSFLFSLCLLFYHTYSTDFEATSCIVDSLRYWCHHNGWRGASARSVVCF